MTSALTKQRSGKRAALSASANAESSRGVPCARQLQAGHVLDVQLAGGFRDVAEQQHLHVERAPALHRAALQRADVARERLRHGEERQHSSA